MTEFFEALRAILSACRQEVCETGKVFECRGTFKTEDLLVTFDEQGEQVFFFQTATRGWVPLMVCTVRSSS